MAIDALFALKRAIEQFKTRPEDRERLLAMRHS
jgi:hypothetical protein